MVAAIECPQVEVVDRDLCVTFPGGARVCVQYPGNPPSLLALVQQLMAQATAGMAPLQPAFSAINAILAIVEWAKSVPLLIVDPVEFAEKTQELIDAAAEVASLAPPLSVPAMIVSMLDVLLTMLEGMVAELQAILDYKQRIADAQAVLDTLVDGNTAIEEAIACANQILDGQLQSLDEAMGSAGGFIELVNRFMSLIGLDPIPDLSDLPEDPSGAIETMEETITTIQGIRAAIPL